MTTHESSEAPRFFFITELIRDKVLQLKGDKRAELGTLADLEIKLSGRYPEVVNLIVGRSFGRPPLEVPFRYVKTIDTRRTVVELPAGEAAGVRQGLRAHPREGHGAGQEDHRHRRVRGGDRLRHPPPARGRPHARGARGRHKGRHAAAAAFRLAGAPALGGGEGYRAPAVEVRAAPADATSTASTGT